MKLEFNSENGILNVKIIGRLDTMTAPKLEEELAKNIDGIDGIVFNLEKLEYISSTGIRILMATRKKLDNMKVVKPTDEIIEIFEMTGLIDVFNIEK